MKKVCKSKMTGKRKKATTVPKSKSEVNSSNKSAPKRKLDSSRGDADRPSNKSLKVDVKYLPPPIKSKVDHNLYRLIQLPNGLTALLISQEDDSDRRRVPSWHHRSASSLGESDYTPYTDEISSPAFNSTGNPEVCSKLNQQIQQTRHKISLEPFLSSANILETDAFVRETNKALEHDKCEGNEENTSEQANYSQSMLSEAAVAMTINVGSGNDPKSHKGLAHFCEHMVHTGSKKFPGEEDYFNLVLMKGGGANAYTQSMTTTYHFSIHGNYLADGLDMFSQMMENPIFNADCIRREVQAVDNEFHLKEWNDFLAAYHILWSTAKEGHPINTFPCGNLQTLLHPEDRNGLSKLQSALKKFHAEFYVASAMTMSVQSPHSLDDMEKMVAQNFSGIKEGCRNIRREMKIPKEHENPFDTCNFKKMYVIKAKQCHDRLILSWALPPRAWQDYKSKSIEFIEALLDDEWTHGLSYTLRQKGWIIDISAGSPSYDFYKNEYTTLLKIIITLNRSAITHVSEIIELVYSYLKRLQEIPCKQKRGLYKELVDCSSNYFKYSGAGSPEDLTIQASRTLQIIPGEDIFVANSGNVSTFDDCAFTEYLKMLHPRMMNIILFTTFTSKDVKFKQQEKYTRTKYYSFDINRQLLLKCEKAKPLECFVTLPENPFLMKAYCTNFRCLSPIQEYVVAKTNKYQVNHFGHVGNCVHKAVCAVSFVNSVAKKSRTSQLKCMILDACFRRLVLESASAIQRAGMDLLIVKRNDVFMIKCEGFMETVIIAMQDLLESLWGQKPLPISESNFDLSKAFALDCARDVLGIGQYLKGALFDELVTLGRQTTFNDLELLSKISYNEILRFRELIKNSSYAIVAVEGNACEEDCRSIKNVLDRLDFFPLVGEWKFALCKETTIFLPVEARCIRVKSSTRSEMNSYVTNYYQVPLMKYSKFDVEAIVGFLALYMRPAAFQILRTEQQLGYAISLRSMGKSLRTPVISVSVAFPASKRSACSVDEAIDKFFVTFYDRFLTKLTQEEFRVQKILWNITPHLTLESVKSWYKDSFLEHVTFTNGKSGNVTWNSCPCKIAKISIQVLGCEGEKCPKNVNCKSSLWSNDQSIGPIDFVGDSPKNKCRPYFVDNVQAFRNTLYF